jgi:aryl-alcohol dehydrogenase-like predicted oxidoreductase
VSEIGLGTWAFGGEWGDIDRAAAMTVIRQAFDLGVTLFDTAQAYGFGIAEALLRDALRSVPREDMIIATKGGLRQEGDSLVRDSSRAWLRQGVESSLRQLGTDYIDLYQLHWPDTSTSFEETGEALQELLNEGKIRHVGVSNFDAAQMQALSQVVPVETLQPPYHLFRRQIEDEILPFAEEHDIGVLVYGPLAHGLLSGRMTNEEVFAGGDWRGHSPDFRGETLARNVAAAERLAEIATNLGMSLPRLAVAWTLAHPAVDVALVGARRSEQLDETTAASGLELPPEVLAAIDRALAGAIPVAGPSPEAVVL